MSGGIVFARLADYMSGDRPTHNDVDSREVVA